MSERIIKFRAWDKKQIGAFNDMQYPHDYDLVEFLQIVREYPECDWELMQFTGLTDKNGKEIYEGDVLKSSDTDRVWVAVWADKSSRFVVQQQAPPKKKFDGRLGPLTTGLQWHLAEKMAVVGNRFENPELLNPEPIPSPEPVTESMT